MPNLKDIRTRINSVKSTEQMTKAMKMVSVARLKSAQNRILNLRDYSEGLKSVVANICLSQNITHPLLNEKEIKKTLIVVVTSDRGLCGGFNGNICRFTEGVLAKNKHLHQDLFFIGRKGQDYFKFRGQEGKKTILNLVKTFDYSLAADIAKELMRCFLDKDYDAIYLHYNEFKNIISPQIVRERLIPFDKKTFFEKQKQAPYFQETLFEIPPQQLLQKLVERYFNTQIYRVLSESVASEHGARMAAMESASKNAGDAIGKLTLKYNKVRQAAITTELTEIIGGIEALKN